MEKYHYFSNRTVSSKSVPKCRSNRITYEKCTRVENLHCCQVGLKTNGKSILTELPVQHNILEDDYVICRVTLIKWVASYAHFMKKQGSDHGGQPSSMTSTGSHMVHSTTPALSLHHEEETSFTVGGHPSDSSRASSHDSNTPHPSLDSGKIDLINITFTVY